MLEDIILKLADEISALPYLSFLSEEQRVYLLSAITLLLCLILLRLNKPKQLDKKQKIEEKDSDENRKNELPSIKPTEESNFDKGLLRSRGFLLDRLAEWFSAKSINEQSALALEEILISADLGVKTSQKIISNVIKIATENKDLDLKYALKSELIKILSDTKSAEIVLDLHNPLIILIVGVNGVGKTTTIAKLARIFKESGNKVLVAAADTFRAAAVEQLKYWADKVGVDIEYKVGENIKPSTIVFDALARIKNEKHNVLIIDTAGRLHNRVNLMNELEAVRKIIEKDHPGAPHETILVLDGSSGQNALQQAREFNLRGPLTGVIITKLDGTPKGGIVVAIKDELQVPIRYIGLGEGEKDLKIFDPKDFVEALLGEDDLKNISLKKIDGQKTEMHPIEPDTNRQVVRARRPNER